MRIGLVATAHGFGHLTRLLALAPHLRGHDVTVLAAACPFPAPPRVRVESWQVDVGLVQVDSITEDVPATVSRLREVVTEEAVDRLAVRLADFDLVVADTSPVALEAARRAGTRAVALGNFDWAWIYRHYPELSAWAERFAAWQAPHPALEVWPGPGMHGFASVRRFGLLGRRAPPVRVAERTVLVCFGGFGQAMGALPELPGVTYAFAAPMVAPPGMLQVDDVPFPALVAGADLVLTKPGYGIFAESSLAGTRALWVHRPGFPEAPALGVATAARGDFTIARLDRDLLAEMIPRALASPRPAPARDDGEAVAGALFSG